MASARPPVSVVVPFLGDAEEARLLAASLEELELGADDELVVADNTAGGTFAEAVGGERIVVARSTGEHSSYHSRNVGADRARHEWLLFIDADCRPRADLVERYFDEPIPDAAGAVAGPVPPLRRGDGRMARYEASRSQNKQALHIANSYKPFGVTANLLVRRAAWEEVGGFQEGVRSGGDADFCWRIQDAGWELAYREGAEVKHLLRESLRAYLRLHARYGAGRRWLGLRHPRAGLGPRPRNVLRNVAGALLLPLAGRFERGLFKAIDVAVTLSESAGYMLGNAGAVWPREDPPGALRVALLADRFPKPSETFVVNEARALAELGVAVEVIARSRPERPALGAAWELDVRYLEDGGILREVRDLAWLVAHQPLGCVADLVARRRWRREEQVAPLRVLAPLARRLVDAGHRPRPRPLRPSRRPRRAARPAPHRRPVQRHPACLGHLPPDLQPAGEDRARGVHDQRLRLQRAPPPDPGRPRGGQADPQDRDGDRPRPARAHRTLRRRRHRARDRPPGREEGLRRPARGRRAPARLRRTRRGRDRRRRPAARRARGSAPASSASKAS